MEKQLDLVVVMPVYNEEGAIKAVLDKWYQMLETLNIRYQIRAYNDGSKDNTEAILKSVSQGNDKILGITKTNGGHGHTILKGYRDAVEDADWIFQIDSDDEMGPETFPELWAKRNDYDFLTAKRGGRKQALARKIISKISRLVVRIFYGKSICWDVNTPYRLMRADAFADFYYQIPEHTFAPNVILTGLAAKNHLRCFETICPQRDRQTGEVSIKKWKLLKAATKSFYQTITFAIWN